MSPTHRTANSSLVSIIIPCYNSALYVGRAIESALNQSHNNIEILVVDDGSTDQSLDVIKRYSPRIRYYSIPHQGAPTARNLGLKKASGEYIQFLDADDIMLERKVELCLKEFRDKIDAVYCGKEILLQKSEPRREPSVSVHTLRAALHKSAARTSAKHQILQGELGLIHILNNPIQTSLPLHRTSTLRSVGGFNPTLKASQDYELHIKLMVSGAVFKSIPDTLIQLYFHDGPERISNNPEKFKYRIHTFEVIRNMLDQSLPASNRLKKAVATRYLSLAVNAHSKGYYDQSNQLYQEARKHYRWVRKRNHAFNFLLLVFGLNIACSIRNQFINYS